MVFRSGGAGSRRSTGGRPEPAMRPDGTSEAAARSPGTGIEGARQQPGAARQPGAGPVRSASAVLDEVDRTLVQVFALVGEAIAGATHALLACDRDAAKVLMARDDLVDHQIAEIEVLVQRHLVAGETTEDERRELVAVLRMLPDLGRNGDLAVHIARRAARGLGTEMSARSRGLVERMGEVATTIWTSTTDAVAERSAAPARVVDDLDDEMDDLHVTLTAELVAGTMPLPVAIELAMVARFYERFGDHAVNLARRMAALVGAAPELGGAGAD